MPMKFRPILVAIVLCLVGAASSGAQAGNVSTADGARVYSETCAACHQASAQGVPEKYPPLAGSEWVTGDERRLLRIVLHGLTGEVDVAGEAFNGAMPGWEATLTDADLAAVTSYVRSAFGNRAAPVSAESVARVRRDYATRTSPWTVAELATPERASSTAPPRAGSPKAAAPQSTRARKSKAPTP